MTHGVSLTERSRRRGLGGASAELREPAFFAPFDLDEHLQATPPGATCRGLFFADLLQRVKVGAPHVDLQALAGLEERRYLAFLEYPYADFLRMLVAAAKALHPQRPTGEGLRRVGQGAYDALLGSHAGRVVFGALGLDAEQVLSYGPRGYRLSLNFGEVRAERVGDRHFRYVYRDFPAVLETYQVGVVEGALRHCGAKARVLVSMEALGDAVMDITWTGEKA